MRILLRNARTKLYLAENDGWTEDTQRARTFTHGAEAVHLAYKLHVDRPELVMQFEDPTHSFSVALCEETGTEPARTRAAI